ncbi:MAG: DUF2207 domain-containing protein [Pseudomonadota bacterium]
MPPVLLSRCTAFLLSCFFVFALAIAPHSACAEEVIRSFVSNVTVMKDGSVIVKETISVNVEQREIRRGIVRELPLAFTDDRGDTVKASYEVLEVQRNNLSEGYVVETSGDTLRIRIGRPDVLLTRSVQVYDITYRTGRQVGFYETYDEVYWNVTGNGWSLPILRSQVRLIPPPGTGFDRVRSYSGPFGSRSTGATRRDNLDGSVTLTLKQRLNPGDGFTVAGIWPKGFVTPPPRYERALDRISALGIWPVAGGYGLLLTYFTTMWWQKGRDPKPGPLVPLYYPPVGLGAAAMRYVRKMAVDNKTLTAAILSMAVKRYLIINEQGPNEYFLERTFRKNIKLTKAERVVADALYKDGPARFDVGRLNHMRLRKAQGDLKDVLKTDYERAYFTLNSGTVILGVLIAIGLLLWLAIASQNAMPTIFLAGWLGVWGFGTYEAVVRTRTSWLMAAKRANIGAILKAIAGSVPLLIMGGGLIIGTVLFIGLASAPVAALAALIVLTCIAFYHWMKAPTRVGRRLLDEIDGFREYLRVAEQDRMEFHNPPELTPELFEAYLPHALALDVEHEWSTLFEEQLSEATQVESGGVAPYRPLWYYAGGTRPFAAGRFSSLIASQFAGSLARASSPPQRSSGSAFGSSGGFSGGGGGGGGGGGW